MTSDLWTMKQSLLSSLLLSLALVIGTASAWTTLITLPHLTATVVIGGERHLFRHRSTLLQATSPNNCSNNSNNNN